MADNIRLITYAEETVTPKDDAIIQDIGVGRSGILNGVEVSASGNTIVLTGGYGVIKGRLFQVNASSVTVQLSSGSTLLGRLYIRLDLSNQNEPISILIETGSTLRGLTKEEDANYTDGIYEMEMATFSVSSTEILNLKRTAQIIYGGILVITDTDTSLDDYTDDGIYYFDHNHTPTDVPGTLVNGWLRVLSGGNARKQILWRQGSENTQADTFVRTFTDGAWTSFRRLVSENEMYYMPGDQVTLHINGGGHMTSSKTYIGTDIPLCKPIHSSVKSIAVVSNTNKVTIRQNGVYLVNDVNISTLSPSCTIRNNGLQLNLNKSSGFGGTNNDTVAIVGYITVLFSSAIGGGSASGSSGGGL